jgi:microsomal dipeptidase-like Zn-dependent dipeptidase
LKKPEKQGINTALVYLFTGMGFRLVTIQWECKKTVKHGFKTRRNFGVVHGKV